MVYQIYSNSILNIIKKSFKCNHPVFVEALTFELLGGLGDTKEFGLRPERQEHYFQPGVMLHLPRNSMFSIAFAFGLTDASDNLFRLM